jgi:hypothetical protein
VGPAGDLDFDDLMGIRPGWCEVPLRLGDPNRRGASGRPRSTRGFDPLVVCSTYGSRHMKGVPDEPTARDVRRQMSRCWQSVTARSAFAWW